MEELLDLLCAVFPGVAAYRRKVRAEYAVVQARADVILHYPIGLRWLTENYLLYSTIASLFMAELLFHSGIDVFAGYPIIVANTVILLLLNRLLIHRNHAIFVGLVMLVSMIAARSSGTPALSVVQQIVGSLVFSMYYFSMLTTFGLSIPRWLEVYCRAAMLVALWGLIDYFGRGLHVIPQSVDPRLHSFFREPSFFVYTTLPAIGIYLNAHLRKGGYGMELAFFLVCYALADSSLGFIGLLFLAFFAFLPRLNLWRMLVFVFVAAGALAALFFLSDNFRLRVIDTAVGIASGELQHLNASTFAVLANGYITIMTFIKHPLIGVGIGGYLNNYQQYLPLLSNDDPDIVTLNMNDGASLFFRTAAELGIFGLVALIGFLIVCSRVKGDLHVDIRNSLVPFFLLRMGRYGAYFSLDLYFFVGIYFLNYMHYRRQLRAPPQPLETVHAV